LVHDKEKAGILEQGARQRKGGMAAFSFFLISLTLETSSCGWYYPFDTF
jgi:hypothetical protein